MLVGRTGSSLGIDMNLVRMNSFVTLQLRNCRLESRRATRFTRGRYCSSCREVIDSCDMYEYHQRARSFIVFSSYHPQLLVSMRHVLRRGCGQITWFWMGMIHHIHHIVTVACN
jgi:hypothetical protein